MSKISWQSFGKASVFATVAQLIPLHILDHGRDLNAVDRWLSEYVLSESPFARLLMHSAFLTLGFCAMSVAFAAITLRSLTMATWLERFDFAGKGLFFVSAACLWGMAFFDSDANQEPIVKTWRGNVHQGLLYGAFATTFLGMAWVLSTRTFKSESKKFEMAFFLIALAATGIQCLLVVPAEISGHASHFGGLTERIILAATLSWVWMFHSREHNSQ